MVRHQHSEPLCSLSPLPKLQAQHNRLAPHFSNTMPFPQKEQTSVPPTLRHPTNERERQQTVARPLNAIVNAQLNKGTIFARTAAALINAEKEGAKVKC